MEEADFPSASMAKRKPTLVFLIRLWSAEEGGEPAWRASLESVSTGEKHGFASLDDLFAFLRQQVLDQAQPLGRKDEESLNK
jgi:hypothetical protein